MQKLDKTDPVVLAMRSIFASSGLSYGEFGERMGYPKATARQSVWQLLTLSNNPTITTLRKFAEAVGLTVTQLIETEVTV